MRKEVEYTITDEGRDKGKIYLLREMPARQAAHWAVKLFTALVNSGFQVSDEMMRGGMAAVAAAGFDSVRRLQAVDANALIDELMTCVLMRRDPKNTNLAAPLLDGDIEEVGTYFALAAEVFKLHTGFSLAADKSNSTQDSKSAA